MKKIVPIIGRNETVDVLSIPTLECPFCKSVVSNKVNPTEYHFCLTEAIWVKHWVKGNNRKQAGKMISLQKSRA